MNTKEILTIIALAALGLCLLCSLAKAAMKGDKAKKHCDKACGAFVFLAIILLAVSQLLGEEKEKYDSSNKQTTIYCDNDTDSAAQSCMELSDTHDGVANFPGNCTNMSPKVGLGCSDDKNELPQDDYTQKCEICGTGKDAMIYCQDTTSIFQCPPY